MEEEEEEEEKVKEKEKKEEEKDEEEEEVKVNWGVLHHQGFGVLHSVRCNSGSQLGGRFPVSATAHVLCISSCLVPAHVQISL